MITPEPWASIVGRRARSEPDGREQIQVERAKPRSWEQPGPQIGVPLSVARFETAQEKANGSSHNVCAFADLRIETRLSGVFTCVLLLLLRRAQGTKRIIEKEVVGDF